MRRSILALAAAALMAPIGPLAAAAEPDPGAEAQGPAAEAGTGTSEETAPEPAGEEESEVWGYIGAGGVGAIEDLRGDLDARQDGAYGFSITAGVRAFPWLGVELGFEWLEGFDVEGDSDDVDGYAVTLDTRWFPFPGRIQPFGLVGIGWGEFDVDLDDRFDERKDDFVARFGGGVEFWMTEHAALTTGAHYFLGTGDLDDVRYTAIVGGLLWHF